MPQGLQIWDASGNLILDTSTHVGRIIGSIALSANSNSYIDVPKQTSERVWAHLTSNNTDITPGHRMWVALVSDPELANPLGTRIRWQLGPSAANLVYGIY